jgi:hypothetical protein
MRALAPELEAKIDEVKLWMLDGDQELVAAKSRKSLRWVNAVLNKHAFNAQILEAAIEVMNENRARFQCTESTLRKVS